MTFLKKQGAAFYFNAVAIVFAIVGIVTMVMSLSLIHISEPTRRS